VAKRSTSKTKAVSKAKTAKSKPRSTKKVVKATKAKTAKTKTTRTSAVKGKVTGKPKVTTAKNKTERPSSAAASASAKKVKSKTSTVAAKKKTAKRTTKSGPSRPVAEKAASPQARKTKATSKAKTSSKTKAAVKTKKKSRTSSKKTAPSVAVKPASPPAEKPRRIPKTHLTRKQLAEFRELLLAKREELAGDVDNLAQQALRGNGTHGGETSSMPIHMADLGSDNWEQEFTLGLIASEKALVNEIDETLKRIEDRTYGVCIATHKPITIERLRAKPWAKYCIDYARLREEGRAV